VNAQTLISAEAVLELGRTHQPLVLLDCGFDLGDADAGERAYQDAHLPQAHYAHLERDLSGPQTGRNGRHPLPDRATFARTLGDWGVVPGVQVVTYDNQGSPYAARAWWLLRWMGHLEVAVLDGGRAAWQRAGGALVQDRPVHRTAAPYPAAAMPAMPTIDAASLLAVLGQARLRLVDARAAERFRGEVEPLDPVAGHIPGATLRCFKDNLAADGCFKLSTQLRDEFSALLGRQAPAAGAALLVVQQCGSGVTACHNLLAMARAGLGDTTLYPGSWSEWCSDAARPVARGD
jgi:thiosulfate/3-mercaptopyruvate sulfurtransferase